MNKGISNIVGIIIVAVILMGGIGGYMYLKNKQVKPIACIMEAKQCPDGSTVNRIAPNCDFAECPIAVPTSTPTSTIVISDIVPIPRHKCENQKCVSSMSPGNEECRSNTDCVIIYSLRDIGPAGGLIFYDKGFYSDGWRYLEASPSDKIIPSSLGLDRATWGCLGINIPGADGTAIGTGHQNTHDMIKAGCMDAAQSCDNLTVNGYNDWFLPSKDELDQMYINLNKAHKVGGFHAIDYWSSSEQDTNLAWSQYFRIGMWDDRSRNKDYVHLVRCARAF